MSTMQWLKSKYINLLDWPCQSPDLNQMENLLGLLVRKVYKNEAQFQTTDRLKVAITDAWDGITAEHREALMDSEYMMLLRKVGVLLSINK